MNLLSIFLLSLASLSLLSIQAKGQKINNSAGNKLDETERKNLETAIRFIEDGLQKHDMNVFDECVATDATIITGLKPSGPIEGIEEYKQVFTAFAEAWPSRGLTVTESFAAGNKVVIRFNSINAFKKTYYGMEPTNQVASLQEVHVMTFENGKIINNVVAAENLEYEYILYPLLKEGILANVKTEDQ